MKLKINGTININAQTPATETPSTETLITKLVESKGYTIRFRMDYGGGEKILSKNFRSKDLSWEELEVDQDGFVRRNWTRVSYINTWVDNLHGDIQNAVLSIIRSKNAELVIYPGMSRLIKYCLRNPESLEAQCVLAEVNRQIEYLNAVAETVECRLHIEEIYKQKPTESRPTMSAADIAAMGAANAAVIAAANVVPTLQEDPNPVQEDEYVDDESPEFKEVLENLSKLAQ